LSKIYFFFVKMLNFRNFMFILQRFIATDREIKYYDYKFLIKTACKQILLNFLTRNCCNLKT